MDTDPTASNKKKFLILTALAIIFLFVVLAVNQKRNIVPASIQQEVQKAKPLSNTDEVALQKQLQDILAKGKEGECVLLGDERYQFACHDFFKIRKEK